MSDYKHEYQKYADDAVRGRYREEAYGRLRFAMFLGFAGVLGCFLIHLLHFDPPHGMVMAIVALPPLSIVLLIVNYIRVPNDAKASVPALLTSFLTLLGAGATLALAKFWEIWK
jgi:hypothetical protein